MHKPAILDKLKQLEAEMITVNLWGSAFPSTEELSSVEPFCVDTMAFEKWLQWIFIPKMRDMLSMPQFNGMIHSSDIHTMASYVLTPYSNDTQKIQNIIKDIDTLLNELNQ